MKVRIIAAVFTLFFAFGVTSCSKNNVSDAVQQAQSEVAQEEHAEPKIVLSRMETVPDPNKKMGIPEEVAAGDRVRFGKYREESDKFFSEAIEWRVVDVQDDRVLIMTRHIIDLKNYHEKDEAVTWEDCSLREWLNGDFYDTAFSDKEKASILETTTEASLQDKVFLLSLDECRQYFSFNSWDEKEQTGYCQDLIAFATTYAQSQTGGSLVEFLSEITADAYKDRLKEAGYSEDVIGKYGGRWWLRSMETGNRAPGIGYDGGVSESTVNYRYGVRPAIWVRR